MTDDRIRKWEVGMRKAEEREGERVSRWEGGSGKWEREMKAQSSKLKAKDRRQIKCDK
jgi:hypothetical protein